MNYHTAINTVDIPNKSVFTTDEVCSLTGVKPYVLRFWENEFSEISPILSSSGKKLFEHKDIEAILVVKKLLFEEKVSIERAKVELGLRLHSSLPELPRDEFEESDSGESHPEEATLQYRRWAEDDIQKLTAAKERLVKLLERSQSTKQSHHWN